MKNVKDEDLDKLFKKGFEDPVNEPVYREADWEAMEQVLEKGKKRPFVLIWMPWIGAAAAIILVLLGWLLFRSPNTAGSDKSDKPMAVNKDQAVHTGKSGGGTRLPAADSNGSKQIKPTSADLATNPVHHGEAKDTKRSYPYRPVTPAATLPAKGNQLASAPANAGIDKKEVSTVDAVKPSPSSNVTAANTTQATSGKKGVGTVDVNKSVNNDALAANQTSAGSNKKEVGTIDVTKPADANITAANPTPVTTKSDRPKVKVTGVNPNHVVFAISAIATTDMNGVNGMQGGRVGGNLGGLFSVNSGKWTLSTGVMYSIKPYVESYANYHTSYVFQNEPSSIGVNCRMLDIPVNVNYQVYKNHANRITLGTGLSSYVILREDYSFKYNNPYAYGPTGYSVINKNRNILSVVNLDATFDHQINSKFGITFEPYVKLPFTNVGASQAKLQSAGIAVSLNYNLNPFKKPN